MTEIEIEEPNGYLIDADGKVVKRFGNWSVRTYQLPDVVEDVEYVDTPSSHERPVDDKYRTETS